MTNVAADSPTVSAALTVTSEQWREVALGDVAWASRESLDPMEHPTELFDHYSIPAFDENQRPAAEYGESIRSRKLLVAPDSVLVSRLNPRIARVWASVGGARRSLASTEFMVLEPRDIDRRFLKYTLLSPSIQSQMAALATGTSGSHQRVRPSDVLGLTITLPPLEEQRAIARVLGTLDDKIELNRRMNETLEGMARALFRSWFVDFDPVRAKAEGRPTGLPPALDALFPASFEASELGEIPSGWQVAGLDDIAEFTNGLALQRFPPEDDHEWLPVIKIAEMRRGYTDKTGKASGSIDPRYIVGDGDVLFSWSGSLELVLWSYGRGALNQHLFKVTSEEFPRWFYLGWVHEHLNEFRRIAAGKATTMGHIQRHHLTDAKVAVPPEKTIDAIGSALGDLTAQQVAHAVESRNLATLRDALLPKLVSGELNTAGELA